MKTHIETFHTRLLALTVAFALVGAGRMLEAQEPSVEDIVNRANQTAYYQGADGRAQVQMSIDDARGQTRRREMIILRRDVVPEGAGPEHCGDQQFYVYFQSPADVAKMTFMVWKHLDRDDDRWLYLPALDLVKRIAASDERTSFVGSDFFYEDVSGRGVNEDKHELVETTDASYVVKSTPIKPEAVEFSSFTTWIDRKTHMPMKTEYLDRTGKLYRRYEVLEVTDVQGHPTVTKARMSNLGTGGSTTVVYDNVAYDLDLPESLFSERYLRRAPRKYLRVR